MSVFQIFSEGKDDKKFIEDYLGHLGRGGLWYTVISAGGWTNLHIVATRFKQISDLGGRNLILFDADNDFAVRRAAILEKMTELQLVSELFLFPDDGHSGNFDTLLASISNPAHRQIYGCFDAYSQCLDAAAGGYTLPSLKDRNYSYFQALGVDPRADGRDYTIPDHWDLNHPNLARLRAFLEAIVI